MLVKTLETSTKRSKVPSSSLCDAGKAQDSQWKRMHFTTSAGEGAENADPVAKLGTEPLRERQPRSKKQRRL